MGDFNLKTPKNMAENARVLGMTFLLLHKESRDNIVHMGESEFNVCGTMACHAGWFAVARGMSRLSYGVGAYDYNSSANDMAKFLGFKGAEDLESWAVENTDMWGNHSGSYMFCDGAAFGSSTDRITLDRIGKHWLEVADRLENLKS